MNTMAKRAYIKLLTSSKAPARLSLACLAQN